MRKKRTRSADGLSLRIGVDVRIRVGAKKGEKMSKKKLKVLFICKKRVDTYGISFGLLNSAKFVANALNAEGIEAKVVTVNDNNGIDKEVADFEPTHCMIEAIWVVPEKFEVLCKLHPKVTFVVRTHSKVPFIAMEGIAIEWLKKYNELSKKFKNLVISANSEEFNNSLTEAMEFKSVFLPNIYMPLKEQCGGYSSGEYEYDNQPSRGVLSWLLGDNKPTTEKAVHVGCFGAIRPLKNHLNQAMAAIIFAKKMGRRLFFHINGNRLEQRGDTVLKNLKALFEGTKHVLVEHAWMPHNEFVELVKSMDIGTQVSFSETFNIVVADFVANDVPIVVSKDVDWMPDEFIADPNSAEDMAKTMRKLWRGKAYDLQNSAYRALARHNAKATKVWLEYLRG